MQQQDLVDEITPTWRARNNPPPKTSVTTRRTDSGGKERRNKTVYRMSENTTIKRSFHQQAKDIGTPSVLFKQCREEQRQAPETCALQAVLLRRRGSNLQLYSAVRTSARKAHSSKKFFFHYSTLYMRYTGIGTTTRQSPAFFSDILYLTPKIPFFYLS